MNPIASHERPRRFLVPRSRRLTIDVLHYHRQVPTCAHDRLCHLADVDEARRSQPERISWAVLFIKAFGLVAQRRPILRQTYMKWPLPHIYQHPESIASIATHRDVDGEPWLFWSRFIAPESQSLSSLQQQLDRCQTEPVDRMFRQQRQLSLLPTPLRRMFWWWTLNVSGVKRAKRTGTFFLTTIAANGAEIQHPPAFLTSNLTYGPLDERGVSRVTIAYDHRLMDGRYIGGALRELESTLRGEILDELVRRPRAAA